MSELTVQYKWKTKKSLTCIIDTVQNVKTFSPNFLLLDKVGKHTAILKMQCLVFENFHYLKNCN